MHAQTTPCSLSIQQTLPNAVGESRPVHLAAYGTQVQTLPLITRRNQKPGMNRLPAWETQSQPATAWELTAQARSGSGDLLVRGTIPGWYLSGLGEAGVGGGRRTHSSPEPEDLVGSAPSPPSPPPVPACCLFAGPMHPSTPPWAEPAAVGKGGLSQFHSLLGDSTPTSALLHLKPPPAANPC